MSQVGYGPVMGRFNVVIEMNSYAIVGIRVMRYVGWGVYGWAVRPLDTRPGRRAGRDHSEAQCRYDVLMVTDDEDPSPTWLSAGKVRSAIGLSREQLGRLTADLELAVGPRPNYPRYDGGQLGLLLAALHLRRLGVPLATVVSPGVRKYRLHIMSGVGYLAWSPTAQSWDVSLLPDPEEIARYLVEASCAAVLDLRENLRRAGELLTPG